MKTWISRLVIVVLVCFTNLMPAVAQNTLGTLGLTSSNYASVAYSVRQLSTGYTGPLMRIRNSTSGNTYDVWPDATGQFSTTSVISAANPGTTPGTKNGITALLTITSTTTFTVAIWYNQSGNANNLTQATASYQPTIITSGTIQTENSKPFIRFYGTTGTASVPSSVYNRLNLASTLSTNGHVSIVNKFASGGDGFILSHSSSYYNWHSDPGNSNLFDGTNASTSLLNSTIKQNGTSVNRANAVFNTSLGINTIQPQTANSGTDWDNIGSDRVYHRVTGGGGYSELIVFSAALSEANTSLVEGSQKRFFGIAPPTITSLSSYSGDIGSTVTITGTGFDATAANNIVYFGSAKVLPSAATTTSLTVTVPAGAIYAPVSVVNTIANLQAFSQRPFNITFNGGNSVIAFKPSLNFTTSSANVGTSVGTDFDGDGKTDFATVVNGSNIVNVFRNTNSVTGTPSFGTALALTPGSTCKEGIAVADFNGDGLMDLVVANNGNGTLAVFKNTSTSGTISFAAAVTFTVGSTPRNIAVGDFDNDGKMDIACPSSNASNNYLSILRNSGTSTSSISFDAQSTIAMGNAVSSVAAGDLDGDGKTDLIVGNDANNLPLRVLRNTNTIPGTLSFASYFTIDLAVNTPFVALADFDSDGKLDIVSGSSPVYVIRNISTSGSLSASSFDVANKVSAITGQQALQTVVGDLNGDGKPDIANYSGNAYFTIAKNTTSGSTISFATQQNVFQAYTTAPTIQGGFIGDLDGDNQPDLVSTNYGRTNFTVHSFVSASISSFSPANGVVGSSVTITGTGFNTTAAKNIVYFGTTIATVTAATVTSLTVTVPTGATRAPISIINIGTNYRAESKNLFQVNFTGGNNKVMLSNQVVATTGGTFQTAIADLNNDGFADIAVANRATTNKLSVFRNTSSTGASTISLASSLDLTVTGTNINGVAASDFDGDGNIDLVCTYFGASSGAISKLTLYRNTTTAGSTTLSFDAGVDIDLSNIYVDNSTVLKVRDFNGDGRPDILFSANKLVLNNITAPGAFTTTSFVTKGLFDGLSYWPTTGYIDLDGDGFLDLVNSTNYTSFNVKRNTGALGDIALSNNQSFETAFSFSTYSKIFQGGAEGDLDGDGKVDLVFMDDGNTSPSNQIIVLRNTATSGTINANSFSSKLTLGPVAGVGATTSGERCWIGLEDMDGDGRLDIIAVPRFTTNSNSTSSPTITVYLNKATSSTISGGAFTTASFSSAYAFGNLGTVTSFSIGDLNNDGKPEIVAGSYANNGFSIFRNYTIDPPTITSLDTYSGAVGSTVVITGTNFSTTAANNVVFFGATQAAVPTSVTSTSLTVTVPTGATYQPVSVTNTENTHIAYSPKPFLVTFTGGGNSVIFKSPVSIATTSAGNAIGSALGDLDGDGKMDLVELLNSGTLTIYKNTSTSGTLNSSSFTKVTDITSAGNYAVKIADIDGDGKMDIVTNQNNYVNVLRNTTSSYGAATPGTISFATGVSTQLLPGSGTNGGLEVADMDGDGKPDIILSNNNGTYTYIAVAKNTSTIGVINSNSFNLAYSYTSGSQSVGLAVSDLDGDGLRDIAVVNYATTGTNPNKVVVLRNTSEYPTMSFATGVAFSTGTNPISVAIGDIDNDNKPDMVVANYGSTSISLFRNTSTSGTITTGSFAAKVDFTTPANPYAVALADINGDGKFDINVVNQGSTSFSSIFRNTATDNTAFSSSTLATRVDNTVVTSPSATSIAIGDIDGNYKNDMVVGNSNGTFYLIKYAEPLHTITSFSPTSGNVGATLTITGTNFPTTTSNIAVYFGATKATVSAATSTSITVTVPTGATYQPITVLNIAEGTLVSSVKSFTPTFTGGNNAVFYSKKVDFTTASNPNRTYLADIDGDGKSDLIVPNYSSSSISVFRNTSTSGTVTTGSFGTKVDFTVSTNPAALAIGDIDNDGKLDIAVANYGVSTISILRNTATSGTIAASSFATHFTIASGTNPTDVAIFDVDGDGRSEIISANYGSTNISLFQNISSPGALSSSSFTSAVNLTSTTQPQSIAVGDFDNDGKIDFAVAAQSSNTVSLFRNTSTYGTISTSSFATKQDITGMPSSPNGIAAGDIDVDGNVDLVVSANAGNTISLLRNTFTSGTTFSFATKVDMSAGSTGNVQGVALGDLDGDGKLDLVAANQASNTLSFFRNTATSGAAFSSTSTFATMVSFETGTNPQSPAIGDLDGDGKADVAVANYGSSTLSVFRYSTSNAISISSFSPTSGNVGATLTITGAGFNATAANNIVYFGATKATVSAATATSLTVTVPTGATHQPITVLNTTEGLLARSAKHFIPTFTGGNNTIFYSTKVDFTTATNPNRTYLADIDGDGKSDLIVPNYSSTSISVFRNTSTSGTVTSGSFGTKVDFTVGTNPAAIAIADIDGDGKLDVAVANYGGASISILRNTATSGTIASTSFATHFTISAGTNPNDVAIFDVDGDGRSEIIAANYGSTNISLFKNISTSGALSSSSFASAVNLTSTAQPQSIAVGDFDNDGKIDFAVAAQSSTTVSLFRNTSTYGNILSSSFATKQDITGMPSSPNGIAAGDIDGDGNVDLVVSANAGNTVSLLRNTFTSGTTFSFATKVDMSAGSTGNVQGVTLGDLDGDGKLDLVAANQASNTLSFFRNTATSGAAFSSSTFAAKITFATATTPQYPAIGDVDGDGKADVVVSNYGSLSVSVFRYSPSIALSSFTPTSGAIGTTVTLTGAGFNATAANNIVYFGATKATVSAASATSLTVTVPAGATFQPINVINTDNGLTAASTTPFKVTFTGGNNAVYASISELTSGNAPSGTAIGDFNRDGKADLVVAKKDGTTKIAIFPNKSTSGSLGVNDFDTKIEYAATNGPYLLTVVDLDGDGMLDIALSNASTSVVSLYRNTSTPGSSTISFAAKQDFTVGTSPYGITSGDLDGDGKPELIVANYSSASVSVLYNQCTKGVALTASSFATNVDFTTGTNPYGVAVSDLDGDGKLDIAVANNGSISLSLFRNTGFIGGISTSSFASKSDYTTGTSPMFIALGDVNGDGKDDIAVSNNGSSSISLFRNQSSSGAFTFDAKVDYTAGTNPSGIAINDLDGDGKLDIAFSNYGSKSISVIRNTSTSTGVFTSSTFATKVDFGANTNPLAMSIGDLDNDGKPDIVAAFQGTTTVGVYRFYVNNPPTITSFTPTSGAVGTSVTITGTNFSTTAANNTVYFGATKATVTAASATSLTVTVPIGATYQPISVTIAENTHIGYSAKPFLVTYTGGNNVTNFKTGVSFATPYNTYTMAVGDLDGDGKSDVVVGTDFALSVWRRNPLSTGAISSTSFTKISDLSLSGNYPTPVKIVDIDGDGKLDLVEIGYYASGAMLVNMFRNITTTGSSPGTITFDTRVDITPNNTAQATAGLDMADIDGDGKPDIIAIDPNNSSLTVFKNTATIGNITTTSFALKSSYSLGGTYKFTNIAIGDVDGDNKPDIIGLHSPEGAGSVVVLHNTSTLTTISFSTPIAYATNTTPKAVAIGDIDGDGKPDLVVTNNASNNISIFRNNYSTAGTPLFESKVDFTTITSPGKLELADFDGDGKLDIALTSTSTAGASVLRNTATSGVINSASLTTSASISTHTNSALAIGDFDGNGKNDIITNSYISASWNFTVNCIADAPPVITSFTPASGAINTSIVISGNGFDATASNNAVYFGDTKATVTAASTTSLTVTVPAGASYKPISVLNKTTNMSAYSTTPFKVTFAGGNNTVNFSTKVDFTSGTNPMGVAFGDFDGDGKTDAAVANFASNNVSVYRNTSTSGTITSSSFDAKVDIATGTGAIAVITGDVDGDGKLDLFVANKTAGTVSVLLNTSTSGTISFATKVDLTTDTSPKYMALGDFNIDGKMDIAVTCEGSFALNVFKNNSTSGSLSFDAKVSVSSTAAAPNAITVADLDADGKPELVATSGTTSGTARIFKNSSTYNTIAFATTTNLTTGSTPYGVTIGDIDGDGLKDIAVANNGSNTMSVFRNTNTVAGTVSFATKIDYTTGTNPYGIAIGDLDGDSKLDLVTANSATAASSVSVFRNTTTGSGVAFSSSTFATKSDFTVGSQPYRVEIADVDGNGRVDVITSNYNAASISVLWNKISPSITSTGTIATVCFSAAAQTSALPYTAALENPTAYSITWNAAALTAGLVNVATTTYSFVAGGGSITGIPVNAGLAAGTYTGTMTITDGTASSTLTVTLTVNTAVTAGTIGNAQSICTGSTPTTITSTGVSTGSGTISYEWQSDATGSYVTIAGAVSATYSPGALTATTNYKRRTVALNSGITCYSDYTTPNTITVNPLPNAVIMSSSGGFAFTCSVTAPITLSVTPQTGNTYSWKIGTTVVSTTSSVSVSTPAAYSLTVTSSNACTATSSATVINDYNAASAAVLSGTTSIPRGTSANLRATITGGTSPFTVVYTNGTNNYTVYNYVSGSNISVSPTVGTNYTLVSVTGANGCTGTGLSGSAYVTVTTGPTSSVLSGSTSICAGGSTNISFAITGGTSPYTVVYTDDITNTPVTLTNYVSGTNVSVTPTGSVTTYSIVSVTDATGFAGTGNTGTAVMTVFASTTPTFTSAPGASTCGNTNVTYTTETGMTNYVWTIPGTLNRDYTITSGSVGTSSNSVVLKWITAGSKVVTVNYLDANGCRSTTASSTTQNARAFTSVVLSGSTTITVGNSANLQVAVNGGTGPYTVVLNDGTADFTVSNYYSGPNITVTPTVTTTYTLVSVSGTTGCATSSLSGSAVITVNSGGIAKTWTGGAGDNLWSSSGNWSPAGTPAGNDLISIASGNPIIDVDFTVGGSLTLSGATTTLTVNPGFSISVASGATVDFGQKDVTFKSTAAGTAQLGRMEGTLSNADSVIVERYFPAGRRAYRFIAPSVTTPSSIRYNWMENATPVYDYVWVYTIVSAYNPKLLYGTHITGNGDNTNGFDRTAVNTSTLYTLNPNTQAWVPVGSTAGTLTAGDAYRILIRGSRSTNLNKNNAWASETTLRAKGTPKTGTVTVSSILSTVGGNWSMVGNPYNALLDLRAASSTNLSPYYHVWDPQRGTRGAYVSYHLSTGYKSNSASEVNEFVQPGQAFFVQTLADGPASLTFEESKKAPAGTQTRVFRPVINYPVLNVSLNYTDSLANGAPEMDALAVLFDNSFSNNVDANDANKNVNQDENMGISRDGKLLSMELRNMYDQSTTIPLNITQYARQNYTLRINWSNPIDAGYDAYIKDNYTGVTQIISFSNPTDYVFTVNSSVAASKAADRFSIMFLPSIALPVGGLELNGIADGKQVKLQFTAINERDMAGYDIERSADGITYEKIGFQSAANGSAAARSYAFMDNIPFNGNNYYRIKGVSINGQQQFSNVKLIKVGVGLPTVSVAPNPASNDKLQLKVTQLLKGNYTIIVTDALGRVFCQKELVYDGVSGKLELKYPSVAKSGSYYVKVNGESGSFTEAFIIR